MANHTIDCEVCGEDLRGLGGGCAPGCPDSKWEYRHLSIEEKREMFFKQEELNKENVYKVGVGE